MRLKSIALGQMAGNGPEKGQERLSDRLVEGTVKFEGGSVMVWGCMLWDEPGYASRFMVGWMGTFSTPF